MDKSRFIVSLATIRSLPLFARGTRAHPPYSWSHIGPGSKGTWCVMPDVMFGPAIAQFAYRSSGMNVHWHITGHTNNLSLIPSEIRFRCRKENRGPISSCLDRLAAEPNMCETLVRHCYSFQFRSTESLSLQVRRIIAVNNFVPRRACVSS